MAAAFCNRCGASLTPGAAYCATCGAPTAPGVGVAPPGSIGYPAGPYPPHPYASYAPARPLDPGVEDAALKRVQWAAALTLAGALLGSGADVVLFSSGSLGSTAGFVGSASYYALLAVAGVFGVLEAYLYYRALDSFASTDREFETPSKLALLLMISTALASLVVVGLVVELVAAENCINSSTAAEASGCISGGLIGLLVLLGLIGLIALVGLIGVLIGIWRLGTRYADDKFKVGAILTIFPYLNIVGAILILVAARGSMRARSAAVASF